MKATIKGNKLVVEIDCNVDDKDNICPVDSKSGKTLVVASSQGNRPTTAAVNGQPVIVGLNAYIRKP